MKIEISSSSNDAIDEKYKIEARKVTSYLAEQNCELIWGSGNRSIMRICYEEFAKKNCKIWGYTTKKYVDEIKYLTKTNHTICDNTFDLKREMFNKADMILMLAGGSGTVSELFTYIEEVRSNDVEKILVIYDETGHFNKCLEVLDDLIERKFNNESIYDFIHIAHNLEEFIQIYQSFNKKRCLEIK